MTALTIWIIGWLFTLGIHLKDCEKTEEKDKWWYWLVLFIAWPHFLGYSYWERDDG